MPPISFPSSLGMPRSVWPTVRPEDWCGEFQRAPMVVGENFPYPLPSDLGQQ